MSDLYSTLTSLLDRLESRAMAEAAVIRWASPVPAFGDVTAATVATLGLNPSNREFVDGAGQELEGTARRFHTLRSLGLRSWADADATHLRLIVESCDRYFLGNPYDRWFRVLDQVLTAANASFYASDKQVACHLDLIPYATEQKWNDLTLNQRTTLIRTSGTALASLLQQSHIRVLILNGRAVVDHFSELCGTPLVRHAMPNWALPRGSSKEVVGFSYSGVIDELSGIDIGHQLLVLGFNHNLQSSYGVTSNVIGEIGRWIAELSDQANVK